MSAPGRGFLLLSVQCTAYSTILRYIRLAFCTVALRHISLGFLSLHPLFDLRLPTYTLHFLTPCSGKRRRWAPLAHWRNERLQYDAFGAVKAEKLGPLTPVVEGLGKVCCWLLQLEAVYHVIPLLVDQQVSQYQ